MRTWPIVVLAWCGMLACAARESQRAATTEPPRMMERDPRAEITQLSNELEAQRAQMGLTEPASVAAVSPHAAIPMANVPSSHDSTCHPGTSQTCTDSCTLSDSICTNARKICDLASQLANDGWAAEKCDRGKQTCDAAHATCCACQ